MNEKEQIEEMAEIMRKRLTELTGSCRSDNVPLDATSAEIVRCYSQSLAEAIFESTNKAIGDRDADMKQVWQNGYDKGKSDTVKEFAEKLFKECANLYPSGDYYCLSEKAVRVADIRKLAKEYGVEVE